MKECRDEVIFRKSEDIFKEISGFGMILQMILYNFTGFDIFHFCKLGWM